MSRTKVYLAGFNPVPEGIICDRPEECTPTLGVLISFYYRSGKKFRRRLRHIKKWNKEHKNAGSSVDVEKD